MVGKDGVLRKGGRPFRGIGVNYFDAFYRHLIDEKNTTFDAGFQTLERYRIPFARVMGCGFWPKDNSLYFSDKPEYFRRMDDVVKSAERHRVGLIFSLFWTPSTVPDLMGEPCDSWGDPKSKTAAFMKKYVEEVVTRYRNSPAIWGWEFGNEYNMGANLPNASEHRPPIVPDLGTPKTRSIHDEWTYETIRAAFTAFARQVRKFDPSRIISTGDALPRPSAWHNWKEKNWISDSPQEIETVLRNDNPDPVSVISGHVYEEDLKRFATLAGVAKKLRKPFFMGEFGNSGPPDEKSQALFSRFLETIRQNRIPLAAVWVFDHGNDDPNTITGDSPRVYQLQAIEKMNSEMERERE